MFSKILIANRGEIACRVMRSARRLGYRCVAVYAEADADAAHVALADEAVALGGRTAAESYLRMDLLLDAARRSGADALHPGYGFLSENAEFARAVAEAGLCFIGPPAEAIAAMGHKAGAKRRMIAAGVPCLPGTLGEDQDPARLRHEASQLGYPLLVKAVAGGGGRGMRQVDRAEDLEAALHSARQEAQSAFGDGRLMLERLIRRGRHIEIQVFADRQGQAVHLGERDCSTQRRRQKLIEEAPSPIVDAALREAMGRDAVAAALAVGYVGAGTVEFIVDMDSGRHHFLEMNTRLQVEHPVTECITGLDLVEWQLRIAAGEPLPLSQDQLVFSGHAIEARLYAEDPYAGFAPQTGRIAWWRPQRAMRADAGLRVDDGIREGGEITPYYDAMMAKLIVHGRDREDALRRLAAALEDAPVLGLPTNARLLRDLLRGEDFRAARLHTTLLDEWAAQGHALLRRPEPNDQDWLLAAALRAQPESTPTGPAATLGGPRAGFELTLRQRDTRRRFRVRPQPDGSLRLARLDGPAPAAEHHARLLGRDADGLWRIELDGLQRACVAWRDGARLQLARDAAVFVFEEPSPQPQAAEAEDPRRALAPVAGLVSQLRVRVGDRVDAGQPLLSVEAMKMEMWLAAGCAGRVKALHATPGQAVAAGALLAELEPLQEEPTP
ncbi:biotin carboxylase N-terminal domain-containing protein [Pelomonas sp. CA6]|uniref:ATP-binding protein n=1 Tax=Pelomonas sp. CA6 TaxID=2907999 RepID=UPI0027E04984|nr:biotin carboxylase N-terminal domain-containing protein [Pelomonas sp. CA6]